MAYACPVCSDPQADGEHLANHLAFTAMLHDDGHADWLDRRVPGWEERDPDGLADEVVEYAEEIDHEIGGEHDHAPPDFEGALGRQTGGGRTPGAGGGTMDEETRRVLEEARAMTERMREEENDEGETDDG